LNNFADFGQFPVKRGVRFTTNAAAASRWSLVVLDTMWRHALASDEEGQVSTFAYIGQACVETLAEKASNILILRLEPV
jgi:hypothetical protein